MQNSLFSKIKTAFLWMFNEIRISLYLIGLVAFIAVCVLFFVQYKHLLTADISMVILISVTAILFAVEVKRHQLAQRKVKLIEQQLKGVLDSATDMVTVVDKNLKLILCNKAYEKGFQFLFSKNIKPGMLLKDAMVNKPEQRDKLIETYEQSLHDGDYIKTITLDIDGIKTYYEISSNTIRDEEGEVLAVIHIERDVTQRIQEQNDIKASYEQLTIAMRDLKERSDKTTLLLEMSDVMLTCATAKELGRVMATYCARALNFTNGILYIMPPSKDRLEECAKWGNLYTKETNFAIDQCWSLRMGHIHYVDNVHTRLICDHVNAENVDDLNYVCVPLRAQNDIYGLLYVEILKHRESNVLSDNERLLVTTFAEVAAISLANVRLRENLRIQSMCDPLTGLYNRRYLGEFLLKQIYQSERTKMPIAVLMLDLDHFKKINDVYGHDAGDIVLKHFSQILRDNIRPGDFAARYGGEEFIIVLYNMTGSDARNRAETIRKALPLLKVKYAGEEIGPLSVSIGISVYPAAGKTSHELIDIADKALYAAKEAGRNKVVLYTDLQTVELTE